MQLTYLKGYQTIPDCQLSSELTSWTISKSEPWTNLP